jgi:hypothetical protein
VGTADDRPIGVIGSSGRAVGKDFVDRVHESPAPRVGSLSDGR